MNDIEQIVEDEVEAFEKEEKPNSKTKKKRKATKPKWRPSSKLATLKAKRGFTARWVSADPAEVARKKAEGWIVMKPKDNVGPLIDQVDVHDGKALHDGIRYRDMIAMMLPDDLKEAREEYHREQNHQAMAGILRDTDNELEQMGAQVYKPKGSPGRIVIE